MPLGLRRRGLRPQNIIIVGLFFFALLLTCALLLLWRDRPARADLNRQRFALSRCSWLEANGVLKSEPAKVYVKRFNFVSSVSVVFVLLTLGGCNKSPSAAKRNGGDGEEKTAQITVWSDQYEIFAEHKAPVAGKPTEFITHVSNIQTGEPRRTGPIRFEFKRPGVEFAHAQAAPERPGIYVPEITFPKEGDWKASVVIPGEPVAKVDLGTIKVFANSDAAAKAEFAEAPEGISFLKEQQWRIRAQSRPATKRTLIERVPLHATVVPAPGTKAIVYPTVTGMLLGGENFPRLGSEVKAGQVMAWVQPVFGEFTTKLVDAGADAIRTKAALEQAQTLYERTKRLFEQQAKSQREVQEAEVAFRTAQASYEAAAAVQNLYKNSGATLEGATVKIGIIAPIDGVLDRLFAPPGSRVTPDQPVFSVVNPKVAFMQAHIPENRLNEIDTEILPTFTASGSTSAVALKFVALGREIDPATRTVPITFEFESNQQILPLGSVGILQVGSRTAAEAVAVPIEATVEEDGIPVVFVQVSGETYQKRDVSLGVRDGNWIEVKSGVAEGERVATEGAYALLLFTKSGTIPAHGHAH
jgi:membrane fusion protein, heavy metal efflux system